MCRTQAPGPGSVLAQEGPGELIFPPKIFIGYIYCNYGAHEHLGGAFANFGSQVGLAFYAAIALKATELIIML